MLLFNAGVIVHLDLEEYIATEKSMIAKATLVSTLQAARTASTTLPVYASLASRDRSARLKLTSAPHRLASTAPHVSTNGGTSIASVNVVLKAPFVKYVLIVNAVTPYFLVKLHTQQSKYVFLAVLARFPK